MCVAAFLLRGRAEAVREGQVLDLVKEGDGGRGWDRTSDPYDVNVVLSR